MLDLKKLNSDAFDSVEKILEYLQIEFEDLGDNLYCACPIHEGSDNDRGFSISKELKMWKCWTRSCNDDYGNDMFGLVRGVLSKQLGEEAEFKDALRTICKALDINSNSSGKEKKKKKKPDEFVRLVNIFSDASPSKSSRASVDEIQALKASEYFMSRGFSLKTLEHFGVGDCYNKDSEMYQRAVTPIHDDQGVLSAYIGRAIREYRKPKFLFTSGFDKRRFLYNYHRAIAKASEKSCLFITEGQGDTWRLFECGIENCVGIFGKSLTKQQEQKILNSGITKIVVLTDNDQAGRESKVQIQRKLARNFKLFFPRFSGKDIGDMSKKNIESKILPQVRGLY